MRDQRETMNYLHLKLRCRVNKSAARDSSISLFLGIIDDIIDDKISTFSIDRLLF